MIWKMRVVAALCLVACGDAATSPEATRQAQSPIAYGSLDSIHTAVVAVLAPAGSNQLEECSGSIVQVKGGSGYVLTAAHCCSEGYVPSVIVASADYSVGEQYVSGGTPVPPAYAVVPASVYYDTLYTGADHDFCMLKFSGATASTPTLALPAPAGDGLVLGSTVEHIGFGITEATTNNSQRRTATDTVDVQLTALILQFSQGGTSHIPGTCAGDSGGPTLFPAGVAQAQQVVVAVQSYGNRQTCAGETLGGASRVTSELGTGAFITSYLADTPTGSQVGIASAPVPAGSPWTLAATGVGLLAAGLAQRGRRRHSEYPSTAVGGGEAPRGNLDGDSSFLAMS